MSATAADVRYKKRWYTGVRAATAKMRDTIVPEDVERFEGVREPCFKCGSAGACKHRPWMIAR